MKENETQPEITLADHKKLIKWGFKKQYAEDKSCYWYEKTIKTFPILHEVKVIYDSDEGSLFFNFTLFDGDEPMDAEYFKGGFDLDGIEPILKLGRII